MGTPFSNANEYTMRAFVVVSSILAACRAEASLPLAAGYGYAGVAPYATYGAIANAHATYGVAHAYTPAVAHAAYAAPVVAAAPAVVEAAPVVKAVAAPAVPSVTSTQYRAGDEFGNNAFGYSNINSARPESPEATPMLMRPESTPSTTLLMPMASVSPETTCPLPPLLLTEDVGPLLLPSTLSPMLLLDMLLPLFPMELSETLP